jgi:DNA-binding transcriptional regulator YdaS (Cro superfamily)
VQSVFALVYDALTQEVDMTLTEYFADRPRGAKAQMAEQLGISRTWLSLVISGRETCSAEMAAAIHKLTDGAVSREDLRPDLFR